MTQEFKYQKLIVVLQWKEQPNRSFNESTLVDSIIVEMFNGEILDKDDIIYWNSELYLCRHGYDIHLSEYKEEVKTTLDGAILGPITDKDEYFWCNWYTEALVAAGYRDYRCYIIDIGKLSNPRDEIRLYLHNSYSYRNSITPKLTDFRITLIPIVYEKLSHAIPEMMERSIFVNSVELDVKDLIRICRIKPTQEGIRVLIDINNVVDRNKELKFKER
ncbi:MAG: hypothetical protein K2H60_07215 [Muribaculaceae bacterium]|nr:hypothetical protein [Muribaculaceae bacterium]